MDHFGENLYNLYGSTEVAWATIATPRDLREAPGTAGRPPRGSVVKIYDEDGKPVPQGESGRIFVGNDVQFEGYTGGGNKDEIDGLLSSGDVGHFDDAGRLFIDGRDDDMIVSRRRERLPGRGRGPAARPRERRRRGGLRRRRREVRPAPEGRDRQARATLTEKDVKDYVKKNLAGYKAPRDVVFVDELPRTSTGQGAQAGAQGRLT